MTLESKYIQRSQKLTVPIPAPFNCSPFFSASLKPAATATPYLSSQQVPQHPFRLPRPLAASTYAVNLLMAPSEGDLHLSVPHVKAESTK